MAWKRKLKPISKEKKLSNRVTMQRQRRHDVSSARNDDIAVIDFETDPFDNRSSELVRPFLAVLICKGSGDETVIWDEDFPSFLEKVLAAILALPRAYTIYAHNGGKFDYMFFIHRLRGEVMFKGRGIMSCKVGPHELRDSFHCIPEKLASYRKDDFDYNILKRGRRDKPKNRAAIIDYCVNDCRYLLDIIVAFVDRFGRKLSIGQAAQEEMKKSGHKVEKFNDTFDAEIRRFYFGGRVECIGGVGRFISTPEHTYKLYDVNSMYPFAMVAYEHPIGGPSDYNVRPGKPGKDTVFLIVECDNYGAFVARTEDGGTSALIASGTFFTTIHEYRAATDLGLIKNVKVKVCYDCPKRTTFAAFVNGAYQNRMETKAKLGLLKKEGKENTREFFDVKKDDMFWKFLLNNSYGKFAQNPRKFKECYITDYKSRPPNEDPENPWGDLPVYDDAVNNYAIWQRDQKRLAFNNVGTAASITGAARATLLRGIAGAVDPVYCDTDSIICTSLADVEIDKQKLGAWDIEDEYAEVIVAGKKLYACRMLDGKLKYRSKGVSVKEWQDFEAFLEGASRTYTMAGPTLTRSGGHAYMTREVRATGPRTGNSRMVGRMSERRAAEKAVS